ncbi:MAG: hypothetical protein RLZZ241_1268 [Bacteroidota bacterium]|jgi:cell division protein FtsQ
MKPNWKAIRLLVLILTLLGAYGFSEARNQKRSINNVHVVFKGEENLYITEDAVNKLLIQNIGTLPIVDKDEIVLNTVESAVQAHDMVKNAQVFVSLDGQLNAFIVQRHPIGRISGDYPYYLDDEGKKMPLSQHHSARVPIISGNITAEGLEDAYTIIQAVAKDEFMSPNLIGIRIGNQRNYELRLRSCDFNVKIGEAEQLPLKFKNFKAFYARALQEHSLNNYKIVNLEFTNQVVCTKI